MVDTEENSRNLQRSENPFAVSDVQFDTTVDALDMTNAEQVRTEHLSAEASVRAIGTLQILGAVLVILSVVGLIAAGAAGAGAGAGVMEVAFLFVFAVPGFFVGRGLRNLKNWARITAAIFCVPGILSPITWIILYCLLNRKAAFVCTPEYAAIRAATPHLKYRTSIIVKFFVWLLIIVLLVGGAALLLS
jgi:hypothetical protein